MKGLTLNQKDHTRLKVMNLVLAKELRVPDEAGL